MKNLTNCLFIIKKSMRKKLLVNILVLFIYILNKFTLASYNALVRMYPG